MCHFNSSTIPQHPHIATPQHPHIASPQDLHIAVNAPARGVNIPGAVDGPGIFNVPRAVDGPTVTDLRYLLSPTPTISSISTVSSMFAMPGTFSLLKRFRPDE
jgi:hypothetical protein